MQFYYPAVAELGEKKLLDPTVPEEEKMFINFTLASIAGLSGDTEKSESYYRAHLTSFEKTDNFQKLKFNKKGKRVNKKRKCKK